MAGIDNLSNKYDRSSWKISQDSNLCQDVADIENTDKFNSLVFHGLSSDAASKKFVNTSVGIVNLVAENVLCHPFIVLRRQCQVHNNSLKYHMVPVTLVPVICHLYKYQGISTLWKGIGSTLFLRGLSLGIEDLLSKITPWPKELSQHSSVKSFFQHTLLKGVTLAIITPFYSASLMETVQSDIASEVPGILDVFREGAVRLLNWTGRVKGRMLPIWALILPTVTLGIARYFFSLIIKSGAFQVMQLHYKQKRPAKGVLNKNSNVAMLQDIELSSSLFAVMASDVIFYPFETIMHRLYLQGTRTIIDDLDTGKSVLPILTNYHGPLDCYESCLSNEGTFGLYKGFGALILQYVIHILLIRVSRLMLTEVAGIMYKSQKPPTITYTSPDPIQVALVHRNSNLSP